MFFNPQPESPDVELLPAALRRDEDLAAIAAACEADVLAAYTKTVPSSSNVRGSSGLTGFAATDLSEAYALDFTRGVYIFLRDYDPTVASCEPLLAQALKREIADLIRWRHRQWRADPLTASESAGDGGKASAFREDKNRRFHESFGVHLLPFDIRPPAAVI